VPGVKDFLQIEAHHEIHRPGGGNSPQRILEAN
jgi:hypothetical protein